MGNRKTATRTGVFDAGAFERAFLAADYEQCRAIVAAAVPRTDAAALALSRVDLRDGHPVEVIERLSNLRPAGARDRVERDIWLGAAYGATGDSDSAHRLLTRAITALEAPDDLYYAALFQKAHVHWMDREWRSLEALVQQLIDAPHATHRGRGYVLRGWILAGKRDDAHGQTREYLRALDEFESTANPDMRLRINTLLTLASLARELGLESVAQRVRTAYEAIHPASGMQVQYFKLTRILGWIDALSGNELSAFRRFRQAADLAPSDLWRVQCISDRATLARATGERAFALDQLYAAHDLASRLSWSNAVEEDRITLLNLAELFGDVDGALAQRYLAQFRSLRTPMDRRMGFSNDARVRGLEAYSSGTALLRLGEAQAARQMLEEAYGIFLKFDYGWRAALAALGMHKATQDARWLQAARKAIEPWAASWIARELRDAQRAHSLSDEESMVTRAQRPILRLLLEGRRNADIAREVGKSPNTVRNHIAEIFRTFDVSSRGELIALLSRRAR
ncbi:MAG TPA: helix-turn-helix transcriptional regulator [Candidatus Baltobacteraceae bacterium]|nr:helix-turn-helix transcriptional regulator [Candidatus Baltobacteraceae bacterium]